MKIMIFWVHYTKLCDISGFPGYIGIDNLDRLLENGTEEKLETDGNSAIKPKSEVDYPGKFGE